MTNSTIDSLDNPLGEPLLPEPNYPEDWECCGSECGEMCVYQLYNDEKAAYDAQQKRLAAAMQAD